MEDLNNKEEAKDSDSVDALRPNIYLQLCYPASENVTEFPNTSVNILNGYFRPPLDDSQWWALERDSIPISQIPDPIKITIHFSLYPFKKLLWQNTFNMALKEEGVFFDIEDIKEIGSDNSELYIYIFLTVNMLHFVFNTLAYYHGIQ